MAAPKRNAAQREEDRTLIATLYRKGLTLRDMARYISDNREYSLSHQMVHKDLQSVIKEWKQNRLKDVEAAIAIELEKINALEKTAWDAWERSLGKHTRTIKEQRTNKGKDGGSVNRAQMTEEDLNGDPRYLAQVQWCIERRCKMLGLDAPAKLEMSGADGGPVQVAATPIDLSKLSDEQLEHYTSIVEHLANIHEGASAD